MDRDKIDRLPDEADVIESDRVRREDDSRVADQPANQPPVEPRNQPNPPHTTKHGITAPKFGSAGSGGAEFEPGPERD